MSKKNKIKKTLVEKILDKNKISYESIKFDTQTEGDVQQIDPDEVKANNIYKTLVLNGNKTGPLVGVLPINKYLSDKKLAKLSGNKKVHMIPLKKLVATSGFEHGANSPVGIREQHNYPIYFDNQALTDKTIAVSAGKVGRSVKVDAKAVAKLVNGKFGDFAVEKPE